MGLRDVFNALKLERKQQQSSAQELMDKIPDKVKNLIIDQYLKTPEFKQELINGINELTDGAYNNHINQAPTKNEELREQSQKILQAENVKNELLDELDEENAERFNSIMEELAKE